MRFPQEFIERVAEANNVVDIISQYTQLKPSGSGLMGRCPFPDHQEKTASFSVSDSKQVYHCFGCHKSGNIFSFLRDYQGMNFPDAVEYLAARANLPMPQIDLKSQERHNKESDRKKLLLKANRLAHDFFVSNLAEQSVDHPVKKYIQKRGLSAETLGAFHVGYAPQEWDLLTQFLASHGISTEIAEEARLIKARKEGKSGHFDLFRDRLMFPIISTMGDVLAFGGRIIEQGEPKYLNSPETPVFVKGRVLYGLEQTARYIRSEDIALIVEGYMDLVSLYQSGIRNVAATMGTALTLEHCKLIKRMTRNVVVLFDGDNAGVEAAERSLPILLGADIFPKGLTLPDNMDPDDFVKAQGSAVLSEMIEKAPDLFTMVLEKWMDDYRGEASQKIKLIDKVKPIIQMIPDYRLKDLYMSELSQKMTVSLLWLKEALGEKASHMGHQAGSQSGGFGGRQKGNQLDRQMDRQVASQKGSYPQNQSASYGQGFSNPNSRPNVSDMSNQNFDEIFRSSVGPQKVQTSPEGEGDQVNLSEKSAQNQIILKGASRAELILLNLALKSHSNIEACIAEQISSQVSHSGVRQLLEKTEQIYRQEPDRFAKLTSLFISLVDLPDLLFIDLYSVSGNSAMNPRHPNNNPAGASVISAETEFDAEAEQKLLRGCFKKVRDLFLKEKARGLAREIKEGMNRAGDNNANVNEKLEQLMNIQRDRHSLNKN